MSMLSGFTSVVSGHQPMLFGTTGYWSKLALASTHLVTFGVSYRRADRLAHLDLPGGQVSAPIHVEPGSAILDAVVVDLSRVRAAVAQTFGSRRRPYRSRLEPVLTALDVATPCSFAEVWARVARATAEAAGLPVNWVPVLSPPAGADTHERLLNRIAQTVPGCDAYVVGPGGLAYLRPGDLGGIRFFVHRMVDPSPRPFLADIVDRERPLDALRAYTLEPLA